MKSLTKLRQRDASLSKDVFFAHTTLLERARQKKRYRNSSHAAKLLWGYNTNLRSEIPISDEGCDSRQRTGASRCPYASEIVPVRDPNLRRSCDSRQRTGASRCPYAFEIVPVSAC